MSYEINVSKNGSHFFATAKRSLSTKSQMEEVFKSFVIKFPSEEGYLLSVSEDNSSHSDITQLVVKRLEGASKVEVNPNIKYAIHRLIESIWTLAYEIKDGKVFIHTYDRDNKIGYERGDDLPVCALIENRDRTVIEVLIGNVEYIVANPKYVFAYKVEEK